MLENRRKTIIISLTIAIAVLVILIIAMMLWPKKQANPNDFGGSPVVNVGSGEVTTDLPPSSADRIAEENSYPLGLKQLAMSFAERYGSYSSDLKFKNLDDLMPFVTPAMASGMESLRSEQGQPEEEDMFQGFTTKALSFELGQVTADKATVIVNTQRLTYLGPGKDANISYRKLELDFVKMGSEWKVDAADWK